MADGNNVMTLDVARAWWDLKFENMFLRRRGASFQDLFRDVMGRRYRGEFRAVRPWGNQGDRKNDGYVPSRRQLFQVYAPSTLSAANLATKLQEDYDGAIDHWQQYFDLWIFVHNDIEGLAAEVEQKLLDLDANHISVKCLPWGFDELQLVARELSQDDSIALFGWPPTTQTMAQVGVPEVQPVVRELERLPLVDSGELTIPPADKVAINGLSPSTESLLRLGARKSGAVRKYFNSQRRDISTRDEVAAKFSAAYLDFKKAGHDSDTIFGLLVDWAAGSSSHPHTTEVSLAVVAYFFEECDIFESTRKTGE